MSTELQKFLKRETNGSQPHPKRKRIAALPHGSETLSFEFRPTAAEEIAHEIERRLNEKFRAKKGER